MLTKDDKNWIIGNFVTKGEFRTELHEVKDGLARVEKLTRKTLTIVEGLAGKVADLDQENKMGARTVHRHGVQIQELAKATSVTLSQ
ncbi:MAG: hypothetical protein Q8L52_03330 [bacterium]|nr:hypothetical protein [bacterium]